MNLQENTSLKHGEYIIKRVLGQGGFGITYLAEQVSLSREVAIKEFFMKDNCTRDEATGRVTVPPTGAVARVEQFRKKFFKEARSLASMDHPNIIGVIDVFEENGTVYYSMPYLPNGSLKSLVQQKGRLPEAEALRYINQMASALKYMHDRHLCHYDVKPDNILIDNRDNAVLIDFGISKNYDADGNETSTTPVGISEGYAPIEQYQGISGFSPASDVYALGATLHYLVMGQVPPSAINIAQGTDLELDLNLSYDTRNLIEMAMRTSSASRLQNVDRFLKAEEYDDSTNPFPLAEEEHDNDESIWRIYWGKRKWWIITGIASLGILTFILWPGQSGISDENSTSVDSTIIDYNDSISIDGDSNTQSVFEDNQRGIDVGKTSESQKAAVGEEQKENPKADNPSKAKGASVVEKPVEEPNDAKDENIYRTVDQMPQFPGGEQALMMFLNSHINYPAEAAEKNIQGRVIVQFVVEKNGSVGEVKVVRSIDKALDSEAIRVVKTLPKFTPGRDNGKAVRVWYTLPVNFRLSGTN